MQLERGKSSISIASRFDYFSCPGSISGKFNRAYEQCFEITCHKCLPSGQRKKGRHFSATTSRHAGSTNRSGTIGLFFRID